MISRIFSVLVLLFGLAACDFNDTFFLTDKQDPVTEPKRGEPFDFTVTDGTRIHGLFLKVDSAPRATVFLFHGSGENIYSWEELALPMVEAGFDVVMMDYRGFGYSEGRPTHENVVADATEMVDFMAPRLRSPIKIAMGHSYGGQVAIHLAHDRPQEFAALVTEGTFTSHAEEAAASVPGWLAPIVSLVATSPYEARELIKSVTIPTLIIHSRDDTIVPLWMGQTLKENSGADAVFWEISGTHALGLLESPEAYIARLELFLALVLAK